MGNDSSVPHQVAYDVDDEEEAHELRQRLQREQEQRRHRRGGAGAGGADGIGINSSHHRQNQYANTQYNPNYYQQYPLYNNAAAGGAGGRTRASTGTAPINNYNQYHNQRERPNQQRRNNRPSTANTTPKSRTKSAPFQPPPSSNELGSSNHHRRRQRQQQQQQQHASPLRGGRREFSPVRGGKRTSPPRSNNNAPGSANYQPPMTVDEMIQLEQAKANFRKNNQTKNIQLEQPPQRQIDVHLEQRQRQQPPDPVPEHNQFHDSNSNSNNNNDDYKTPKSPISSPSIRQPRRRISEDRSAGADQLPSKRVSYDPTTAIPSPPPSDGINAINHMSAPSLLTMPTAAPPSILVSPPVSRPKTFDEMYQRGRELGAGVFARVFLATKRRLDDDYDDGFAGHHHDEGERYAVKEVDCSKMHWSGRDTLQDEIENLKQLQNCPHVIRLMDVFPQPDRNVCYLVMELAMPGDQLFNRVIQRTSFTEHEAREACRCVLVALEYMHERRIVHRDVKPENILLAHPTELFPVKLCDFGFSKHLTTKNGCITLCGTSNYVAPEILERWPSYDTPCDMWSFGVVLFFLLGGYLPFDPQGQNNVDEIFERTRDGEYMFHPKRWTHISHSAKELVAKCLTKNPARRITAAGALHEHEWMQTHSLPQEQLSVDSLKDTTEQLAKHQHEQEQQKILIDQQKENNNNENHDEQQLGTIDPPQTLNKAFSKYMEKRKGDSIVSRVSRRSRRGHKHGPTRTISSRYEKFEEDSPSGQPYRKFYITGEFLGRGGFAVVYRCTHVKTKLEFAVKEIDTSGLNAIELETLRDEVTVLKYLRGAPSIIRLFDVFKEPGKTYLILEEMKGGDLLDRISERASYTEREARNLCRILYRAVEYCHSKKIAHRDIKLENLLLTDESNEAEIKLADFGFAKIAPKLNYLKTFCGTPNYMAPEIWKKSGHDYRSDMWSVGVVVYCLLVGYLPFEGSITDLELDICRGVYEFEERWWKGISQSAKTMVASMLQVNPDKRYSASEALACSWMGIDDEELVVKDLTVTQQKLSIISKASIREDTATTTSPTTTSKDKFKNLVHTIIGANKFNYKLQQREQEKLASLQEEDDDDGEEEEKKQQEEEENDTLEKNYQLGNEMDTSISLVGKVLTATHMSTGKQFVVKQIQRRTLHPLDVAALGDEIRVLKKIQSEYNACTNSCVIQLQDVYEDPDMTHIVLEHIHGQPLIDKIIESKNLTEFDAKEYAKNLLIGIDFLHQRRIAIRNLTIQNILLPNNAESRVKITDFECAKIVNFPNSLRTQCGTQEFVAPEVLENSPSYDVSCDMWSAGVIIFIMLGGYFPFRGKTEEEVLRKVRYGLVSFRGKYERFWKNISIEAKSLMRKMFQIDPSQRITAREALDGSWARANRSLLSTDLSDNVEELKKEAKLKFKSAVQTVIAARRFKMMSPS